MGHVAFIGMRHEVPRQWLRPHAEVVVAGRKGCLALAGLGCEGHNMMPAHAHMHPTMHGRQCGPANKPNAASPPAVCLVAGLSAAAA
ncbi:hypothetical protein HaLaN_10805, partial [Haematococcus lacustris]